MERLGALSRTWARAAFAACAAWLLLYELRVIVAPGLDAGPLTSRFAHDVVLLVASRADPRQGAAAPAASGSRGC